MASRSPEFLIHEDAENEDDREHTTKRRSSLEHCIASDLILMLAGDHRKIGKIPLFYFYEGNA